MQDDKHNLQPATITEYRIEVQRHYPKGHRFCNIGWYNYHSSSDKLEYVQRIAQELLKHAFDPEETDDDVPETVPGPAKYAYRILKKTTTIELVESKFVDNPDKTL